MKTVYLVIAILYIVLAFGSDDQKHFYIYGAIGLCYALLGGVADSKKGIIAMSEDAYKSLVK